MNVWINGKYKNHSDIMKSKEKRRQSEIINKKKDTIFGWIEWYIVTEERLYGDKLNHKDLSLFLLLTLLLTTKRRRRIKVCKNECASLLLD